MVSNENKIDLNEKALLLALDVLMKENLPILYCNFNLTDVQIIQKIISVESGIDIIKLKSGFLNKNEYENIKNTMKNIYEAPLYILDKFCEIEQIFKNIAELSKEKNVKKLYIDYSEKDKEIVKKIVDESIISVIEILNKNNN